MESKMAFRFRKSVGTGVGRVNFSKSGTSLSVGGPGHSVSFGKRGARATVGIRGTGMSWSTRLGGRRRRSSHSSDPSNIGDALESGKAAIEASEIAVKEKERLLAEAEDGLAGVEATVKKYGAENLDPDQASEIEAMRANIKMGRANLKLDKVELKQARRNARKIRAYLLFIAIKKLAFWGFILWVLSHFVT
jgi:hypothetical protein